MAFNSKNQFDIMPFLVDYTATAGVIHSWKPRHPIFLQDVGFICDVAISGTGLTYGKLEIGYTPTGGTRSAIADWTESATNLATAGTEYAPDTAFVPQNINSGGDLLDFKIVTALSGTAPVGKGYYVLYYELVPDGVV